MKMNLQTKTEKNNFIGLLLAANTLASVTSLALLLIQFVFFPQYFGLTWTFLVALLLTMAYFNVRFFKAQYKTSALWQWLKNHS